MSSIRLTIPLVFLLLFNFLSYSQEIPPVNHYAAIDYNGGNQNWMIDQDENGWMYFANNDGLIRFNGAQWSTFPSPNNSIMRSVKVIDEKIYTGCYMEFGYWEPQANGSLSYTSISEQFKSEIIEDEQFWNITDQGQFILFQSLNRILIYDTLGNSLESVDIPNGITKMFSLEEEVYVHSPSAGIYRLEQGEAIRYIDHDPINNSRVAQIVKLDEDLLVITQQGGAFVRRSTGEISRIDMPEEVETSAIYSARLLKTGLLALGTISNGTFITDRNFNSILHLNQATGLSNNTVLACFEDTRGNLWTAMDNGINCINLKAPFRRYYETDGKLGTVYTSAKINDILYLGTNQGLFYKRENEPYFNLINGTGSQVWSLFYYDETLFCGHDGGTFIVKDNRAEKISEIPGTWDFRVVPGYPDLIIQGNYNGFNVLEKTNGVWQFSRTISGFNYSAKHFEITDDLRIYMSHEYKGVFELEVNESLTAIKEFRKLDAPEKGKNSGLAKFGNDIFYASPSGIFKLNTKNGRAFKKDSLLSSVITGEAYISGKMIRDKHEDLWLFTKENLIKISEGAISQEPKIKKIPVPYNEIRAIGGYEHILALDENRYLIGSTDGYLRFDQDALNEPQFNIQITAAHHTDRDQSHTQSMRLENPEAVNYKNNTLNIAFTIPEYQKHTTAKYQYHLSGVHHEWTPWSSSTSANFENLAYGKYTFKVRGKIGNQVSENIAEYHFEILPPWYFSNPALFVYFLMLVATIFMVHQQYKRYYQKKQQLVIKKTEEKFRVEKLEKDRELVKLRNEKLQQDVASKNRELAASTMNIIKKNEFLIEIRDQLKKVKTPGEKQRITELIKNINKDINEEDNWNMFKDAFNNADKDFLKSVKALHPNLTPNDLRLCAYLRLNLSSKEIAPLLNISVRSVEIKRYRLRKKMELDHEKGLTEYILSL